MNIPAGTPGQNPLRSLISQNPWPLACALGLLVFAGSAWSQASAPGGKAAQAPEPKPTYSEKVLEQGDGWQLVLSSGVLDETGNPYSERMYMVNGAKGIAGVPLPDTLKVGMIDELAAAREDEPISFSVSARVADEVQKSEELGRPTDELIRLASLMEEEEGPLGAASELSKRSCGDRDISRNRSFSISAPLTQNFGIGGGFTGTLALTGSAAVSANGEVLIKLKRAKVWFVCIPYGVRFNHARIQGSANVQQGATLSGTINYANSEAREWQIAKPHLFSLNFFIGPVPVHIGFNLPITAGFDQGGITGNVTGSTTYSGNRTFSGTFDYLCTSSNCSGTSQFNSTGLGPQPATGSVSGRFQPNIFAQVGVRAYLYTEGLAYAQVGVRPYLRGDLWGYHGNTCGDANGDGHFETVSALTFDLDWQVHVTGQADTFATNVWKRSLWASPRWHIGFWDLLGGNGSTAMSPMLSGPALVPVGVPETFGARMRPCWPYTDTVQYRMNWGDGSALQALSGPAASVVSASHAWAAVGMPQLTLTSLQDSHGRSLNKSTTRSVQASNAPINVAPRALATASSTLCSSPGAHCYSAARVNDGSTSTSLGGQHSWTNAVIDCSNPLSICISPAGVNDGGDSGGLGGSNTASTPILPQWVRLSWPAAISIRRIELFTTSGFEIREFVIQSLSGTQWITLSATPSFPTNSTSTQLSFSFPPVTTQAIRVLGRSGPAIQPEHMRINELQVYR